LRVVGQAGDFSFLVFWGGGTGPEAEAVVSGFLAASSALTRQQLGWNPTGPDLLTDLRNMDYSVV